MIRSLSFALSIFTLSLQVCDLGISMWNCRPVCKYSAFSQCCFFSLICMFSVYNIITDTIITNLFLLFHGMIRTKLKKWTYSPDLIEKCEQTCLKPQIFVWYEKRPNSLFWLFVADDSYFVIVHQTYIESPGLRLGYFDVKLLTSGQM